MSTNPGNSKFGSIRRRLYVCPTSDLDMLVEAFPRGCTDRIYSIGSDQREGHVVEFTTVESPRGRQPEWK